MSSGISRICFGLSGFRGRLSRIQLCLSSIRINLSSIHPFRYPFVPIHPLFFIKTPLKTQCEMANPGMVFASLLSKKEKPSHSKVKWPSMILHFFRCAYADQAKCVGNCCADCCDEGKTSARHVFVCRVQYFFCIVEAMESCCQFLDVRRHAVW